jgi:hypothetical protein
VSKREIHLAGMDERAARAFVCRHAATREIEISPLPASSKSLKKLRRLDGMPLAGADLKTAVSQGAFAVRGAEVAKVLRTATQLYKDLRRVDLVAVFVDWN